MVTLFKGHSLTVRWCSLSHYGILKPIDIQASSTNSSHYFNCQSIEKSFNFMSHMKFQQLRLNYSLGLHLTKVEITIAYIYILVDINYDDFSVSVASCDAVCIGLGADWWCSPWPIGGLGFTKLSTFFWRKITNSFLKNILNWSNIHSPY